jgi:hypothetical protein
VTPTLLVGSPPDSPGLHRWNAFLRLFDPSGLIVGAVTATDGSAMFADV